MRILWTLFKIILALCIAIPLGIVALAVGVGVLSALLGLAVLTLKVVFAGFVVYGLFRVVKSFFAPSPAEPEAPRGLPAPDPYYQAAMRELDTHIGPDSTR